MGQSAAQPSYRGEFVRVLLVALVIVLSTALPYIYAYLTAPEGTVFSGLLLNPIDGNTYLSKMMQGYQNGPVFRLIYTSEEQQGAFLFGFYLFLGMFAGSMGQSFPLVFHIVRLIAGVGLLITAFYSFGFFLRNKEQQWLAFLIFSLGSGFGWLGLLVGYLSPDITIPEMLTYTSILANPHFPLGLSLMLGAFMLALRSMQERRVRPAIIASILSLFLGFIQPNMMVTLYAVLAVWFGWSVLSIISMNRKLVAGPHFKQYLIVNLSIVLISLPSLTVTLPSLYFDPILKLWTEQNLTPSPWPWEYAIGFGFIGLLAILGLFTIDRKDLGLQFLFCWLLVNIVLLYSPFSLQRRLSEGLLFPVTVFAVLGLFEWIRRARSSRKGGLIKTAVLGAVIPTNIFLLLLLSLGGARQPDLIYLPATEVEAMQWLKENGRPETLVLAAPLSGIIIPSWTGNRVYYGHPFETVRAVEKETKLKSFFTEMEGAQREMFLKENGVEYLYYGRREKELATFNPYEEGSIWPIYTNREVTIFRVVS